MYPTPPTVYLQMLETIALQCMPRKKSKEEILGKIDRRQGAHEPDDLRAMRTRIEEAASATRIKASLLNDLSITSATKGALSCAKPQMRPYSGICPSPGMLPCTADERMLEVTKQATVSTRLRFVNLDIDWLTAHANLAKWEPHTEHRQDLPMTILQHFDRMSLDCTSLEDRATFCATIAAEEFLDDQAMHVICSRPGSHFAAVDQCPKSLLHCGGGGFIGGAHHQLKLAWKGVPTDSNISLEAGIHKGKLPRHLVAAH